MSEWISVNEYLPENGKEVLLAITFNTVPVQAFRLDDKWFGSSAVKQEMKDGYCENSEIENHSWAPITHWCELPKMPTTYDTP